MRIDDAEPAQWVVVENDEYEPVVRYFVKKAAAEKVYDEYKAARNGVVLAQIVAQNS
jgi:hypothetical protein